MTIANDYLDEMSRMILQLYKEHPFQRYSLSELSIKTDMGINILAAPTVDLKRQGLLEVDPNFAAMNQHEMEILGDSISVDTPLCITYQGKKALEKFEHDEKLYKRGDRRAQITLIIAALALLLSLLSIAWQIYTWTTERVESRAHQNTAAATTAADVGNP